MLEFDAEIGEQLQTKNKGKTIHLNVLLKELLKHERAITDIYRLWLMADLTDGNQLFDMDSSLVKKTNEVELLRPVLEKLSGETAAHFKNAAAMDRDSAFRCFAPLFDRFGTLQVTKTHFIEKGK